MVNFDFTPDEMEVVGESLRKAFLAVYSNLATETKEVIDVFWVNHLKTCKPYLMTTPEGLKIYVRTVFQHSDIADFVMQYTSTFFALWGRSVDARECLANMVGQSLCAGLGLTRQKEHDYRGMPDAIHARLASDEDAVKTLKANSWAMVLALSTMFMTYKDHEEATRKPTGKAK